MACRERQLRIYRLGLDVDDNALGEQEAERTGLRREKIGLHQTLPVPSSNIDKTRGRSSLSADNAHCCYEVTLGNNRLGQRA